MCTKLKNTEGSTIACEKNGMRNGLLAKGKHGVLRLRFFTYFDLHLILSDFNSRIEERVIYYVQVKKSRR